jgi:hypothetical protein
MQTGSIIGLVMAISYVLLIVLSVIFVVTWGDASSGLITFTLLQPWPTLFTLVLFVLPSGLSDSSLVGLMILILSTLLNAAIIYLVVRAIVQRLADSGSLPRLFPGR